MRGRKTAILARQGKVITMIKNITYAKFREVLPPSVIRLKSAEAIAVVFRNPNRRL